MQIAEQTKKMEMCKQMTKKKKQALNLKTRKHDSIILVRKKKQLLGQNMQE